MGEFNDNVKRPTYKRQTPLLADLSKNNLISSIEFHDIKEPTWSRENSNSQLDDIWINAKIIHKFGKLSLLRANGVTDSDHRILRVTWYIDLRSKPRGKKKAWRKKYQYDKVTEEEWEEFREYIRDNLRKEYKINEITTPTILNKAWYIWNCMIKRAAKRYVKEKQVFKKEFEAHIIKATEIHSLLKRANKAYKERRYRDAINRNGIVVYGKLYAKARRSATNKETLHRVRDIENYKEKKERIQYYIEKRQMKFAEDTKDMIKSVLRRDTILVTFNNVKKDDHIITNTKKIKKEIEQHFMNWTQSNSPVTIK
ncbi:18625_t:CDS:2 [Gigaspora margarita]|uniref:18625_t:CDS:1 n=1 Tax=Gigaspora margarita TaxID=4874 RepID=A0ABN7VJM3_GIGMA|nr:18625_t:CDS:2 [Gigaspora margarita]